MKMYLSTTVFSLILSISLLFSSNLFAEEINQNNQITATTVIEQSNEDILKDFVKESNISKPIIPESKEITKSQSELLSYAYEIAKADGFRIPEVLLGIIMVESQAGLVKTSKIISNCYGVGQIKVVAALDVLKFFPSMKKELKTGSLKEIEYLLKHDDKFNIRIASKYLLLMDINKSKDFGITAYNIGKGGAQKVSSSNWGYTMKVNTFIHKFSNLTKRNIII